MEGIYIVVWCRQERGHAMMAAYGVTLKTLQSA